MRMLSKIQLLLVGMILLVSADLKAEGYHYKFEFKNLSDTIFYFAHHYGDKQFVVDTVYVNKSGEAELKADTLLPSGMYLVVFPSLKNKFFELVIDEPKFSVTADANDFVSTIEVKGSKENQAMYEDLRFLDTKRLAAEPISTEFSTLEPANPQYEILRQKLVDIDQEVKDYRSSLFKKSPNLLYSKILRALQDPELPPELAAIPDQEDTTYSKFFYFKKHAFDGLDFQDERLVRTPVMYNLIYKYLNTYTVKSVDSIKVSVDEVLRLARADDEVFKFALIWTLNEYANSNLMGMDEVYVHIVENYYDKGEATWLDEAALLRITSRAKSIKPTLIGRIAPDITMKDINGKTQRLYDLDSKYTILYFWDPDCSHCREETPLLKTAFDKLRQTRDISIYSVNTQLEIEKWLKFIDNHQLSDWIHVADFDHTSTFRSLYDLNATPVLLLLDENKEIIAKRIISDQLEDFLNAYERNNGK